MDPHECISNAIGAWDCMRHRREDLEGELRDSLIRYADAKGPRPERLFREVLGRQHDCESALRAVLDVIDAKDPLHFGDGIGTVAADGDGRAALATAKSARP